MPNEITGANNRSASQLESGGLRRRAPAVERLGRHHGGAVVARFCHSAIFLRQKQTRLP